MGDGITRSRCILIWLSHDVTENRKVWWCCEVLQLRSGNTDSNLKFVFSFLLFNIVKIGVVGESW